MNDASNQNTGLRPEVKAKIEKCLGAEYETLIEEQSILRAGLNGRQNQMGSTHQADCSEDECTAISRLAAIGHELVLIRSAHNRLRDNMYGICMACHMQIELGRLEANPHAQRCCTCQKQTETPRRK